MKNNITNLSPSLWKSSLDKNPKGEVTNSYANLHLILTNDDNLRNRIAFNEFNNQYYRTDFFNNIESESILKIDLLTQTDKEMVEIYISNEYLIKPSLNVLDKAIKQVALNNRFHPVKDFIESTSFDPNFSRKIDTELIELFTLEDNEYNRWVSRLFFVSLVSMIYYPSSKFDFMFVFEGSHSIGKTTFLNELGGEWFGNSLPSFGMSPDGEDTMSFNWLVNDDEMTAFLAAKEPAIKRFITETTVFYRSYYSGDKKRVLRHSILTGTSNDIAYLDNQSQAVKRRLLPVISQTQPNQGKTELFNGRWRRDILPKLLAEAKHVMETDYTVDNQAETPTVIDLMTVGFNQNISDTLNSIRNRENLFDPDKEQILNYLESPISKSTALEGKELQNQINDFAFHLQRNPSNGNGPKRDRVSTKELVKIAMFKQPPSLEVSKKVRTIMNSLDEWEYRSSIKFPYGVTSGWIRK